MTDNGSDDPMVRGVIEGFQRRGMFHSVDFENENNPNRVDLLIRKHREILGDYFVFIEGDVAVFETDLCWLSRLVNHIESDSCLAMLGSYIDVRDFVDPNRARLDAPHTADEQRDGLIKAHSPERHLNIIPPLEAIIEPFNPPGRLLMLRTSLFDTVQFGPDYILYDRVKRAGYRAGIATNVRHRHLSLLNFFDYPDYDMRKREEFFCQAAATCPTNLAQ